MRIPCLLLFICICITACNKPTPSSEEVDGLGVLSERFEGNSEARPHFDRGMLLLHSFEYADAREAFLKAQEADPDMVMAVWGEAMTYNHGLWGEQDYEAGVAALQKLGKTPAEQLGKTDRPLEEGFIGAIQALYAPEKPKQERDMEYREHMEILSERFPDNGEVSAFYALSILGSVPEGRDDEQYEMGAKIVKGILAENAQHPGALHYLIHSYDDPDHASMALEAADQYARVAPEASHALHMPSHIYVAMGLWEKVVASNEDSYHASLSRMKRKSLNNDARGYHAYHWLQYGYLQQGRVEEARNMLGNMYGYAAETPSTRARQHVVFLRGTYLAETDNPSDELYEQPLDIGDLNISVRSQYNFQDGYRAFLNKDAEGVAAAAEKIRADYENEKVLISTSEITVCSGLTRENASEYDIRQSQLMENQLHALHAWLTGEESVEERMKAIVKTEVSMSYSYGPPHIQKPGHEIYAGWLMENERYEEALAMYEAGLKRAPLRVKFLIGRIAAARALGLEEIVTEGEATVNQIRKEAGITELRES
ncbi:hypothetical protein [Fulvivirga sedimenti]|uniref:Tetratricopeptide repeat protein n=1 Tax=Fulvivirga sedimenti TaxID=2879465 RepID=A0A9X1HPB0_9BACT|nr:hypothetical protein [Fulvivirga sedimenti]MCA6074292.1 hypothetical protein [Fulvivirga sedimenti]